MTEPSLFADDALLTCTNVLASHKHPLVSISGGQDSDVMLDIISRTGHMDRCTFLFVNTGLEYKDHGTYWTTPCNKTDKDLYHHPTIKPLDIIRTMVRNSSKPGDTVLDPFLGSGTTQVQCALEDRICVGQEIDQQFQPIIQKRLDSINTRWFR